VANVRLVVTNGCSFTHGTSLAEPERTCWPRVLADALDAPLVNLAAGGGSNHRLVRTTVEQLPQVVDRAGCTPQETLFVAMWTELARSEVYDPSTPDTGYLSTAFADRPWHRIGIWSIDRGYRPARQFYRHLQHDEGDFLSFLLGYALLESFLRLHGFRYAFVFVEDLLPPGFRPDGYEHTRLIDERHLLGGWDGSAADSFVGVIKARGLPMSGRQRGVTRGRGHPLEAAHRVYALEHVLPFVRQLLAATEGDSRTVGSAPGDRVDSSGPRPGRGRAGPALRPPDERADHRPS